MKLLRSILLPSLVSSALLCYPALRGADETAPVPTGSESGQRNSLEELSSEPEAWKSTVEEWKKSGNWPKKELVDLLKSGKLSTRCHAIDVLEDIAGDNFGFDPWLAPERVPADIFDQWDEWLKTGKVVKHRSGSFSEEEKARFIEKQVGQVLTTRDRMKERASQSLEEFADDAIPFITQYLESHPELPERSRNDLLTVRNRLLLSKAGVQSPGKLAALLTQGSRDSVIQALEDIRSSRSDVLLPVVEQYLQSKDALIRETATDVFITIGKRNALEHVLPMLEKETDPNILQIAFRRSIDYATPRFVNLCKKYVNCDNEDLAIAALETLSDMDNDRLVERVVTQRKSQSLAGAIAGAIFGSSDSGHSEKTTYHGLTPDDLKKLLANKNWRIRQAALSYLMRHHKNSTYGLDDAIIKCISDEDASVRETALSVCLNCRLRKALPQIQQMALQTPEKLPFVIYALAVYDERLSDQLKIALKRASGEQVAQIMAYEEEYSRAITASDKNRTSKEIFDILLHHDSSDVQNIMAGVAITGVVDNPEYWPFIMKKLESGDLTEEARCEILSGFEFEDYEDNYKEFLKRALPDSEISNTPNDYYSSGSVKATITKEIKENEKKFIEYLRSQLRDYDTSTNKTLAKIAFLKLLEMGDPGALQKASEQFFEFDSDLQRTIAYALSSSATGTHSDNLVKTIIDNGDEDLISSISYGLERRISILSYPTTNTELKKGIISLFNTIIKESPNAHLYLQHISDSLSENNDVLKDILRGNMANDNLPADARYLNALAYWFSSDTIGKKDLEAASGIQHPKKDFLLHLYENPGFSSDKYAAWLKVFAESDQLIERQFAAICCIKTKSKILCADLGNGKALYFVPETYDYEEMAYGSRRTSLNNKTEEFKKILEQLARDKESSVRALAAVAYLYNEESDLFINRLEDLLNITSYENRSYVGAIAGNMVTRYFSSQTGKMSEDQLRVGRLLKEHEGSNVFYISSSQIDRTERNPGQTSASADVPLSFAKFTTDGSFARELLSPDAAIEEDKPDIDPADLTNAPIAIIFFEKAGCPECRQTRRMLDQLSKIHPRMRVITHQITTADGLKQNEALCNLLNVSHKSRYISPSVFMRSGALIKDGINEADLARLARESAEMMLKAGESKDLWYQQADISRVEISLKERLSGISVGIVLAGGLLDGINPCAFATLIFFLSYLQISRRNTREMLMTGLSFILAIFLTYFAIGIMFHRLIGSIQALSGIRHYVDGFFILLALLAAILSFRDAMKAKRGNLGDMTLTLPGFLKDRIRAVTRAQSKSNRYIIAAFAAGVIISFLELACTGQVYAPIIYQIQEGQYSAIGMLALYNIAFVTPLIIIFILTYRGLKTQSLIEFQKKHTFAVKLGMGLLFIALAAVIAVYSFF